MRIVSLVPSITSIICDLTYHGYIVGITEYCPKPKFSSPRIVKGPWNIAVDQIKAMRPDIVFVSKEENLKQDVLKLLEEGINTVVTSIDSLEKLVLFLSYLKKIIPFTPEGENRYFRFLDWYKSIVKKRKVSSRKGVIVFVWWDKKPIIAGRGVFVNEILEKVGLRNGLFDNGYLSLSLETLRELSPEIIFLPDEPYKFSIKEALIIGELFKNAKIFLLPGRWLFWYDLNLPLYIESLAKVLDRLG